MFKDLLKMQTMLMDENVTGYEGGGNGDKNTSKVSTPEQKIETDNKTPQGEGDQYDDYGYKKQPGEEDKPSKKENEPDDDKSQQKENEKEVDNKVTGYEEDPEQDQGNDKKLQDDKSQQKEKSNEEFEIDNSDKVLLDKEVEGLKSYIKENKLSKEEAEKLVKYEKDRIKQYDADYKKSVEKKRSEYIKDLKEDKDFAGEDGKLFEKNINLAEKVLEEYGGDLKKQLEEANKKTKELTGATVPLSPKIMKMLAGIGKALYDGGKFVNGNPPQANQEEPEKKDRSPLDFYNEGLGKR